MSTSRLHRELLLAVESARTRLAVAMAVETKSMPKPGWQYYLETDDHLRRLTKRLRSSGRLPVDSQKALRALQSMEQIVYKDKALRICRHLREIVFELQ